MGKKDKQGYGNDRRNEKKQDRTIKQSVRKERKRRKYNDAEWKKDFEKFEVQLAKLALKIKDVAGDGNCLFRAVADQIDNAQQRYDEYRQKTVNFVEKNKAMFEPFVDDEDGMTFQQYCKNMRNNGEWAGHIELQAASLAFGVNIIIHQLNAPRWEVINHTGKGVKTIQLSYHDGEHYCSVHAMNEMEKKIAQVTTTPLTTTTSNTSKATNKTTTPASSSKQANSAWQTRNTTTTSTLTPNGDYDLTPEERLVYDSTPCKDPIIIRETLIDYAYDVDAAIEFLILTQEAYKESQNSPAPKKSSVTIEDYVIDSNFDAEEYIPPEENTAALECSSVLDPFNEEKPALPTEHVKTCTTTTTTSETIPETIPESTEQSTEKHNKKDQEEVVSEGKKPKGKEKIEKAKASIKKSYPTKNVKLKFGWKSNRKKTAKQEAKKERKRNPTVLPEDDDGDLDLGALSI